ncbi:MAG: TraR/DksA family transcriptional regulator [Gammaproteobacteria bacterium]
MSELTNSQLSAFRAVLLNRKTDLLALKKTGREATQTVQLDQTSVGRLSRMDALQGQAMSQEAERRRTLELQRIEPALQRLGSGDFGYCLRCDENIALERLECDPSVTLCIECASQLPNPGQ